VINTSPDRPGTTMTTILSSVEEISRLTIEPFPTNRQIRGARIVKVDRYLIAVDEKGNAYSTQVSANCAYTSGVNLAATLKGLQRLGAVSKEAVKEHEDARILRAVKGERHYAAQRFQSAAFTLGLKLTNAQHGAIKRAIEEGK